MRTHTFFYAAFAAIILCVSAIVCAEPLQDTPITATAANVDQRMVPISPKEIQEIIAPASVFVRGIPYDPSQPGRSLGSGQFVDMAPHEDYVPLATNFHVAGDFAYLILKNNNGQTFTVSKAQFGTYMAPKKDTLFVKVPRDLLKKMGIKPVPRPSGFIPAVGQPVVVYGAPFGNAQTVTRGTISATQGRYGNMGNNISHSLIQTDASINPGNSGGGMYCRTPQGVVEWCGMPTMIQSRSGSSSGVGFALPISSILQMWDYINAHDGNFFSSSLGVMITPNIHEDFLREHMGFSDMWANLNIGARVQEVTKDSPAEKIGLQKEDIILQFNARFVQGHRDLPSIVSSTPPNVPYEISFFRPGEGILSKMVTLEDKFPELLKTLDPKGLRQPERYTGNTGLKLLPDSGRVGQKNALYLLQANALPNKHLTEKQRFILLKWMADLMDTLDRSLYVSGVARLSPAHEAAFMPMRIITGARRVGDDTLDEGQWVRHFDDPDALKAYIEEGDAPISLEVPALPSMGVLTENLKAIAGAKSKAGVTGPFSIFKISPAEAQKVYITITPESYTVRHNVQMQVLSLSTIEALPFMKQVGSMKNWSEYKEVLLAYVAENTKEASAENPMVVHLITGFPNLLRDPPVSDTLFWFTNLPPHRQMLDYAMTYWQLENQKPVDTPASEVVTLLIEELNALVAEKHPHVVILDTLSMSKVLEKAGLAFKDTTTAQDKDFLREMAFAIIAKRAEAAEALQDAPEAEAVEEKDDDTEEEKTPAPDGEPEEEQPAPPAE